MLKLTQKLILTFLHVSEKIHYTSFKLKLTFYFLQYIASLPFIVSFMYVHK